MQDAAAMVRDYVKWDDQPISLTDFSDSAVRAYKIAMTPPMMPVLLVADASFRNVRFKGRELRIPKVPCHPRRKAIQRRLRRRRGCWLPRRIRY